MCPVNVDPRSGVFDPIDHTHTVMSSLPEINNDASSFHATQFTHPPWVSNSPINRNSRIKCALFARNARGARLAPNCRARTSKKTLFVPVLFVECGERGGERASHAFFVCDTLGVAAPSPPIVVVVVVVVPCLVCRLVVMAVSPMGASRVVVKGRSSIVNPRSSILDPRSSFVDPRSSFVVTD